MEINLKTKLGKIELNTPVIMASGTFGYGTDFFSFLNYRKIGAITTKTITFEEWKGNPQPRISEIPCGMINCIGLQNPGVNFFCENIYPQLIKLKKKNVKLFVSITDRTLENILKIVEKLNALEIDAIELNMSCPNFEKNKKMISQEPKIAFSVVKEVKKISKFPVISKLTPNVTDITEIAKAVEEGKTDIISVINTVKGIFVDWKRRKIIDGGISGTCIKPVGLKAVYEIYKKVEIPIIGIGGITSGKDAVEYILIGADAVGIGSGFFSNPEIIDEIYNEISVFIKTHRLKNIKEMKGMFNEKKQKR